MTNQPTKHTYLVRGIETLPQRTLRNVVYLVQTDGPVSTERVGEACVDQYGIMLSQVTDITGRKDEWCDRLEELSK